LFRSIVYISEMDTEFSEDDIDVLAARARAYNDRVDISGILFCFSDRFIQILEGPSSAVGKLYNRIRRDPRHRDVTTVQDVPIEKRAYGGWGMRRVKNEDLSETERALVFHALQVFEPQTLIGPRVPPVDGASATFMKRIMARAQLADLPTGHSDEISSLLYAAEIILMRDLVLSDDMLDRVAQDAQVSSTLARTCFPTISDLMRTCVLRIVALEHQAFLAQMVSTRFEDKAQLAGFITDVVVNQHNRTVVSHRFADQFAKHGDDFTRQTAWIIALAAVEATPREGWPFADLDSTTLAAAIGATDGAARILARHDFLSLADPETRTRLFRTCLVAMDGYQTANGFLSCETRASSLIREAATLVSQRFTNSYC
jgi:hypothetical protein